MVELRDYLGKLEKLGQLRQVDLPVSVTLQAAAALALVNEQEGPALLFRNVSEAEKGFSLVGGLFTGSAGLMFPRSNYPWSRLAVALGLEANTSYIRVIDTLIQRGSVGKIRPVEVKTAKCKENTAEDIDLSTLPIPKINEKDGGRYSTVHTVIVKDPDTGWTHWGNYRWSIIGKNRAVVNFPAKAAISSIWEKYRAKELEMPVSIALGCGPEIVIASSMSLPEGTDSASVAGGLAQEPVEVVRGSTNDLLVPANAEVVMEGKVSPNDTADEGPFVGLTNIAPASSQPVVTVQTVTHRTDPVIAFDVPSVKPSDALVLTSILHSVKLTEHCRGYLLPIKWIMCPLEMRMGMCVVSTQVPYNGFIFQLVRKLFNWTEWFDKVVAVDTDVEPEDLAIVFNDIINKTNPAKGWRKTDVDARPVLAAKYPIENDTTARLYINTTWDPTWPREWIAKRNTFEQMYSKELQERVYQRWTDIGYNQPLPQRRG